MFKVKLDIENKAQVIKWLEKVKRGVGDARPLFRAMDETVVSFVDNQFKPEGDQGKRWKELTTNYLDWKKSKGYSPGIGVRTGDLATAAGSDSIRKFKRKVGTWSVNPDVEYAKHFDKKRDIYRNVTLRLNSFMKKDAKIFNNGTKHNSFTYIWFRDTMRRIGT